MKRTLLTFLTCLFCLGAFSQNLKSTCLQINQLNNQVLNGTIKRADAAKELRRLTTNLQKIVAVPEALDQWIFPLKGYNYHAIGGTNGNGYNAKGYNYLDGNKHSAHPAHDIFINDKNQDCLDDKTGEPVNVLAAASGYVIACGDIWEPNSNLRGGKYIWIYDVYGQIEYYAHNRQILVKPGDKVTRGDKIAEVGRTGFNAYKKRSPTHLHFSAFNLINGLPIPYNPYPQLKKALPK